MKEIHLEIMIGGVYKHIDGPKYRVDEILPDASGYETTGEILESVKYEQLEPGDRYPAGTIWIRRVTDFLDTVEIDGQQKKIFEPIK